MSTRPTPGGDVDVWGHIVNQALDEIEAKAEGAQSLAEAAQANALEAKNINAGVAQSARQSAQEAQAYAEAAAGSQSQANKARVQAQRAETSAWEAALRPITVDRIQAAGAPSAETFLRGDGTWAVAGGSGGAGDVDGGTPYTTGAGDIDGGTP